MVRLGTLIVIVRIAMGIVIHRMRVKRVEFTIIRMVIRLAGKLRVKIELIFTLQLPTRILWPLQL